jgi:hypothetical protein
MEQMLGKNMNLLGGAMLYSMRVIYTELACSPIRKQKKKGGPLYGRNFFVPACSSYFRSVRPLSRLAAEGVSDAAFGSGIPLTYLKEERQCQETGSLYQPRYPLAWYLLCR